MPTLEEVQRCPKCGEAGQQTTTTMIREGRSRGGQVLTYVCRNEACRWFNTGWVVQIQPDGTIPERKAGPKQFETLTPGQETFARDVLRAAEADAQKTVEPNSEVRKGPSL